MLKKKNIGTFRLFLCFFGLAFFAVLIFLFRTEITNQSRHLLSTYSFSLVKAEQTANASFSDEHKHEEPSEEDKNSLALSDQALLNIGLDDKATQIAEISDFQKTFSIPAMVVDRPGRSLVRIPSSVSGIITRIYVEPGKMVFPGEPLFDIQLAPDELIQAQTELLSFLQKKKIIESETERLKTLSTEIAPKSKRETAFQKSENDALIEMQISRLKIFGLSDSQIDNLIKNNSQGLIRTITVRVPEIEEDEITRFESFSAPSLSRSKTSIPENSENLSNTNVSLNIEKPLNTEKSINAKNSLNTEKSINVKNSLSEENHLKTDISSISGNLLKTENSFDSNREKNHLPLQLEKLWVEKGQQVEIGDVLCQISDMEHLMIEGNAYAFEERRLNESFLNQNPITAVFEQMDGKRETVSGLRFRFIGNRIDPETRTLSCFVDLPNTLICGCELGSDSENRPQNLTPEHCINWKYKPGQRCELLVEFETLPDCIVLPLDALAESQNETFVFIRNGFDLERKKWTRRPVHVLFRTRDSVVLANDGSLFPGDEVAVKGAGQLLLALTDGGGKLQSTCPCGEH